MKTNTDLFEKAPVPKAVATMAVPTMISMLVVVIYNMADTFFIGQTKDPLQVAAVSLATPVFMIFMALGHLFGIGGQLRHFKSTGRTKKRPRLAYQFLLLLWITGTWCHGSRDFRAWHGTDPSSDRRQ